jgi:pilus assembly protein CpaD
MRNYPTTTFFLPLFTAVTLLAGVFGSDIAAPSPAEAGENPTVGFETMTHQVNFAPGSAALSTDEINSLSDFLTRIAFDYGDKVTISIGPTNSDPSLNALAAQRAGSITFELQRMHLVEIQIRPENANIEPLQNAAEVSIGRYVVTGPKCADWSEPEAANDTDMLPSNFGCATAINLGAMVANPADLLRGTPSGSADADFVARGIEQYRNGEVSKSLDAQSSKGAAGTNGATGIGGGTN